MQNNEIWVEKFVKICLLKKLYVCDKNKNFIARNGYGILIDFKIITICDSKYCLSQYISPSLALNWNISKSCKMLKIKDTTVANK